MQLIAEAYDLICRQGTGASAPEISEDTNEGDWSCSRIEITADWCSGHTDAETGKPFVDIVLDRAEQKGTGADRAERS